MHHLLSRCLPLFLLLGLLAAGEAPDPVAVWRTEAVQAWEAMVVAPWRTSARHGSWDADAPALLAFQPPSITVDRSESRAAELAAQRMLKAGCSDPILVALCLQRLERRGAKGHKEAAQAAWEAATPATTPPLVRVYLMHSLQLLDAELLLQTPQVVTDTVAELVTAACAAGPGERARRMLAVEAIDSLLDGGMPGRDLVRAGLARPGLDRWTTLTLSGIDHITQAWDARGGGWGSSVTEEGWKGFHTHLAQARQALEAAWQVRSDLPDPAIRLLTVALGDRQVDSGLWFERAIALNPRHRPAWRTRMHNLMPRWGGEIGDLLALARRAVESAPDGALNIIGWDCLGSALDDATADPSRVWLHPDAWPVCDRITRESADDDFPAWRRGMRLILAVRCRQPAEYDRIYDEGGGLEARTIDLAANYRDFAATLALATIEHRRHNNGNWSPRPFPGRGEGLPRTTDLLAVPRSFCVDDLPGDYRATGVHGPWDADALIALGPLAHNLWTGPGQPPQSVTPEQAEAAGRARAAGCQDAGVLLLAARKEAAWQPSTRLATLRGLWRHADTAQPYIRFLLSVYLSQALAFELKGKDPGAAQALHEEAAQVATSFETALSALLDRHGADPAYAQSLYAELAWALADPTSELLLDAQERVLARPQLDPWLRSAGLGQLLFQRARKAGLRTYRNFSRLQWAFQAYRHLVTAFRLQPERIEPTSNLITVAWMAGMGWDLVSRYWFDESIRRCYDHRDSYSRFLNGCGTSERPLAMALAWADGDPASRVPALAVSAVHCASQTNDKGNPWRKPEWWEVVDRATCTALAGPQAELDEVWLRHYRIAFAMAYGKEAVAAADWKALGKRFDPKAVPRLPGVQAFTPPPVAPGDTAPAEATPAKPNDGDF